MKRLVVAFILLFSPPCFSQVNVPLTDTLLRIEGAPYSVRTDTLITLNRHKTELYNNWESGIAGSWINQWVITQSGVKIIFKTTSPTIQMKFQKRQDGGEVIATPTNGFGVFVDGNLILTSTALDFQINNPNPGVATRFEVSLPNLWAVDLVGVTLESGHLLDDASPAPRPVYAAFGHSVVHGTGQYVSSHKTFPFLLADCKNWELNNYAVAGSTLGWAIALNVKDHKPIDVITILIGYNDWVFTTTSIDVMKSRYSQLVDSLRSYQPNANIYCITSLETTQSAPAASWSIQEYRDTIASIVGARTPTDSRLFLIDGPSVSNVSMLGAGDPVHLSESGASTLASNLCPLVYTNTPLSVTPIIEKKTEAWRLSRNILTLVSEEAKEVDFEVYDLNGRELDSGRILLETGINEVPIQLQAADYQILIVLVRSKDMARSKLMLVEI